MVRGQVRTDDLHTCLSSHATRALNERACGVFRLQISGIAEPVEVQEERRGTVTASIPKNIFGGIRGVC